MCRPGRSWLWLPLVAALAACSDDEPSGPSSVDAAVPNDAGRSDGGVDGGTGDATVDGGIEDGPQSIVFLHTNDEHSHYLGAPNIDDFPTPSTLESVKGGITRRARLLQDLENEASRAPLDSPVAVVGAGGLTMGTLFGVANLLLSADYIAASALEYDVLTLGASEFDFGPDVLATMLANGSFDFITMTTSPLRIPVVTSNIRFSMTEDADDALAALYGGQTGRPLGRSFVQSFGNVRVGFVGFMGTQAAQLSPFKVPVQFSLAVNSVPCTSDEGCPGSVCVPAATAPTATSGFCAVNPNDAAANFPALVADVAAAVQELRNEGVDLVVALSHAGVDPREIASLQTTGMSLDQAQVSEDLILAREVDRRLNGTAGIDLLIGGFSQTALESPLVVPNALSGIETFVVQAGKNGEYIGKVRLTRGSRSEPWVLDADYSGLEEVDGTRPTGPLSGINGVVLDGLINQVIQGLEETSLAQPNDGFIFPGEQCDTVPGGGFFFPGTGRCSDIIPNTDGFLLCHANRQLDFSSCSFAIPGDSICGNGIREDPELCDTADLPQDCASLGYQGGAISCANNCTLNVSACIPDEPSLLEAALNFERPEDEDPIEFEEGNRGSLFFRQVGTATFSVGGRNLHNESNLLNLVADANRFSTNALVPDRDEDPVRISIVANGIVRDGLFQSQSGGLSVADLFRVIPLGISPIENTPGYSLVDFNLTAAELKDLLETGLSLGAGLDPLWLGVSGARIEFDPGRTGPLDQITRIELVATTETDPTADVEATYDPPLYDAENGGFVEPNALVRISSDLYLALLASGLGVCPRQDDGEPFPHCAPCTNDDPCTEPGGFCDVSAGRCAGSAAVAFDVRTLVPAFLGFEQELKEFLALIGYLRRLPNDAMPEAYRGPVPRRMCCVGPNCPDDDSRTCAP